MTIKDLYEIFTRYPSVQTDTRKLQVNDLFFALSGSNFNGNLFALDALAKGAAYAVVDENIDSSDSRILVVENVLETLQALAKLHRQQFNIPFIAITGSNGKTTTKELVHAVLSTTYTTYTTVGNLNNHIGVPLTLLSIKKDAQMAVIEMGANHQQEIKSYCAYTLPTHGIITNCGKAHLEGFGGVDGVRKGKGELFDYLRSNNGTAFIFDDYGYLHTMSAGLEVIRYGTSAGDVRGDVEKKPTDNNNPFLQVQIQHPGNLAIPTQLVGDYNLPNVLCAVAVGNHFKVDNQKIKTALQEYLPENSRSQMLVVGTNQIILDAYNANPSSMEVAIKNFAALTSNHKILMLGGMKELGEESIAEHQNLIQLVDQYNWKQVILVGGDFIYTKHSHLFFNDVSAAAQWYHEQKFEHTYQLIKGSRGIQMERILKPA